MEYEIDWHKDYLKKLHHHKKKPSSFHRERTSHPVSHDRLRHFKEQVIEAIPFHESIIEKNKKRLQAITSLIPKRRYQKIVRISMANSYCPEYFVFDKETKEYFFVSETSINKSWHNKTKSICETIEIQK